MKKKKNYSFQQLASKQALDQLSRDIIVVKNSIRSKKIDNNMRAILSRKLDKMIETRESLKKAILDQKIINAQAIADFYPNSFTTGVIKDLVGSEIDKIVDERKEFLKELKNNNKKE